jgi:hypothetical protein
LNTPKGRKGDKKVGKQAMGWYQAAPRPHAQEMIGESLLVVLE